MKKYIFFLIIFFIFTMNFFTHNASAAPKLEVNAEVGIAGKLKYFKPTPLKITVTNNGSDFSGDLVINAPESYSVGSALVYPLNIAEGETKTVNLTLNALEEAYYVGQPQDIFYFYEGGIDKGKKIDYKGTKTLRALYQDSSMIFIFTLTENSDRLSGLFRLNEFTPNGMETFHLNDIKGYELPTDSKALQMADIFLVDEVSLTDLSEEQQKALYNWVESGGTLLIGASDQISSSMGTFQDQLPLQLSNGRVVVPATSLSKLTNGGDFNKDVEVQKASLNKDSQLLLKDGSTILAASKKIGNGQIVQTAFSLGDQPLAGMSGYGDLISKILDIQNFSPAVSAEQDFYSYLPSDVGMNNEIFPSFEVKTTWLIVIIFAYILLVGPILYVVLKKMDKREHAWWIIPSMAIVISLVMFIFGAKDRLMNAQIQQASYLKVNDDKSLEGFYINSLLTNKSGDYTFTTNEDTSIVATKNTSGIFGTTEAVYKNSYVTKHANGSTLKLKDLSYWSVQSVIGKTKSKDVGNMDVDIKLTNNKLEGTIKNNFPFKLNDVSIWSGTKEIKIGNVGPNETLKVSEKINSTVLLPPIIAYGGMYQTPNKKEDIMKYRLNSLKYGLSTLVQNEEMPVIIAWAEEPLDGVKLEGNSKIDATNYIVQTFKPTVQISGDFTINNDALYTNVSPHANNVNVYVNPINRLSNIWEIESGEYEYEITIPEEILGSVKTWKEFAVKKVSNNLSNLQIWNQKYMRYEDFPDNSLTITSNLQDYIAEGIIKVKFNVTVTNVQEVRMPEVELKGVAK